MKDMYEALSKYERKSDTVRFILRTPNKEHSEVIGRVMELGEDCVNVNVEGKVITIILKDIIMFNLDSDWILFFFFCLIDKTP